MRGMVVFAALLLAVPAFSQTNKADVFSAGDIKSRIAILEQKAKVSGAGGATLDNYGSHSIAVSVRNVSGGAEVHAHFDDVFFVTEGKATLVTGGTVVGGKTGPDGETRGSKLDGGTSRTISTGDVVNIPAGIPHQILVDPGMVYSAIVIKVKES